MEVSETDIKLFVKTGEQSTIEFERYPYHAVTLTHKTGCEELSCNFSIRSHIEVRCVMPVLHMIAHYNISL